MADRATLSAATIGAVVERITRVPDAHRRFDVPAAEARRVHGIGPELQDRLLDLGLPHRGSGADRRYDRYDLENAGLELGIPCPRRTAMRWWSQSLDECERDHTKRYRITVSARCPAPGHRGECDLTLRPAAPGIGQVAMRDDAFEFDLALPPMRWYFGEPFSQLIEQICTVRFHLLPPGLTRDLGFLAATGLADCRLAMLYFARESERMGLPVRCANGLFVALPYPVPHCWLEFQVGARWLAADPFLLTAFARWGVADREQWPANRSPQAVLWRLADDDEIAHATHQGAALEPSFAARPG